MKYSALIFLVVAWVACQNDAQSPKTSKKPAVQAHKKANGDYSEIIRIEDSIFEDDVDTSLMAKMQFEETVYDFGEVNEGDIVKHTFRYKNVGKRPLLLKVAHSTCGCTVPHYNSATPIPPGGMDSIVVVFNTTNKTERQEKPITVIANSHPNKVILYLRGLVKQKTK